MSKEKLLVKFANKIISNYLANKKTKKAFLFLIKDLYHHIICL